MSEKPRSSATMTRKLGRWGMATPEAAWAYHAKA
jgi:hypothetical protein